MSLLWQADLVVSASRELSDIEKVVYCEDRGPRREESGGSIAATPRAGRLVAVFPQDLQGAT